MKNLSSNMVLVVIAIIILIVVLPLLGYHFLTQRSQNQQRVDGITATADTTTVPGQKNVQVNPLISRNMPSFASSGYYPASNGNDDSYDTMWRSQGVPTWLAYDLSGVPVSKRNKVLVAWYNESTNYNHTIIGYPTYNVPQDYTIDVNAKVGGSQPPAMGWVTLVTVRENHYHSRQHVINMVGYNWIRIHITSIDGSVENYDASINMDVYDASAALADDWIFYGDSISDGGMEHHTLNGIKSFSDLINAQLSAHFPIEENGGIGYLTSADGAKYVGTWLGQFPGKYVSLSYGTNDALGCANPGVFYNNYVTMVQAVLRASKTPVIPHMPWGKASNIQKCGPALNAKFDALYKEFPQIVKGPDLWGFFKNNRQLISNDNIHPTDSGFGAYRQQWANAMLAEVYTRQ